MIIRERCLNRCFDLSDWFDDLVFLAVFEKRLSLTDVFMTSQRCGFLQKCILRFSYELVSERHKVKFHPATWIHLFCCARQISLYFWCLQCFNTAFNMQILAKDGVLWMCGNARMKWSYQNSRYGAETSLYSIYL